MGKKSFEEIGEIMKSMDTHLGRQILTNLKKNPEKIYQVNITTGESETQGSLMLRSIRVAQALTSRGIDVEKVMMLCGNNHNDLPIPVISSLYLGTALVSLSMDMTHIEIKQHITMTKPHIIFCDAEKALIFKKVLEEIKMSTEIVVFGNLPNENFTPFADLLKSTDTEDKFQPTNFDPTTTTAFITLSSGTSGLPKGVCLTHQNLSTPLLLPKILGEFEIRFDVSVLAFSPFVWISGLLICILPAIISSTRFQTHLPFTPEIAIDAINKYKPQSCFLSSPGISSLLNYPEISKCDFSSIQHFLCGGSNITYQKIEELQKHMFNGTISNCYGATEVSGIISMPQKYKKGSCGHPVPWIKWKIVDPVTRKELGPHEVGELVVKSPWVLFKCYYNDPESTAAAYDDDGWFRTGDLLYYDDDDDLFVVDRMKELMKYRGYQVAPAELEQEISKISGVCEVCVVGLPHPDDGHHPAAIVQLMPGSDVTSKDIKKYINDNLSDVKHLRGGVVFLDTMPLTHSGKINRKALNDLKETLFKVAT